MFFVIPAMVILFFIFIIWPSEWMAHRSEILEFQAVKTTIVSARQQPTGFETATFTAQIAQQNQWLAKAQYWGNKPLLVMFWPREINKLTPIE